MWVEVASWLGEAGEREEKEGIKIMVYCTATDVKLLVKTSKSDADVTSLIVLTDAEVDDWESKSGVTLSAADRKFVSMRMAAILIANGEPEAANAGDYGGFAKDQIAVWQSQIDGKLKPYEAAAPYSKATAYSEIDES